MVKHTAAHPGFKAVEAKLARNPEMRLSVIEGFVIHLRRASSASVGSSRMPSRAEDRINLPQRLRSTADRIEKDEPAIADLYRRAADEIEQLRAEKKP